MKKLSLVFMIIIFASSIYGKSSTEEFHKSVNYVDMDRFSGDWYVIALIPTFLEKKATDGIENYSINDEGEIRVEYTYKKDGKDKVMYQKGWIYNEETNSEWRVQPLWPLKMPYYILELGDDYSYTIIGTNNYDYLWIMARTEIMDKPILNDVINRMADRGFNREKIIYMKHSGVSNE